MRATLYRRLVSSHLNRHIFNLLSKYISRACTFEHCRFRLACLNYDRRTTASYAIDYYARLHHRSSKHPLSAARDFSPKTFSTRNFGSAYKAAVKCPRNCSLFHFCFFSVNSNSTRVLRGASLRTHYSQVSLTYTLYFTTRTAFRAVFPLLQH